ncbi:Ribonucleotide reductase, barrel domain [seawater metagenome]|uniref:ribonucleoside-diphosphate reductase n=1 Tax=seawater metagenome TaxID=1561972 RepID=A0A5E8CL80_9ZZZZ
MKPRKSYSEKMEVIKRNGRREPVQFDKITSRIRHLITEEESKYIDATQIAHQTILSMYNGITTEELDQLSSNICASFITIHPLYNNLGAKIGISNLHKMTLDSFSDKIKLLYNNNNNISKEYYEFVMKNRDRINKHIKYERDYDFDFFGFKTLERAYLMKLDNKIVERPQDMIMRVNTFIHMDDIDKALKSYDLMSEGYFTHASPTLFNSGTTRPQLSSCFLLGTDDSIEGIFKTFTNCGYISKWAGGIGVHVSNIRANGSNIQGTNGQSSGIVPMLKVYNEIARYINQGGKRKGSIAIYLEPFHADIFDFLELRKNTGSETERARDLFLALWIPDLFMKKVEKDEYWHLMCPHECPGLTEVYGDDFDKLYNKYIEENKFRKRVKAREIWDKILESQIETGVPYIAFKDSVNKKSNQKNIGTIKSSNLCIEIMEYSDENEYAVCNLASIAVNKFVDPETKSFDYDKLYEVAYCATDNLNKVINLNYYPTPETKRSNLKHRPVGLGIQGLADAYALMRYPFASDEANLLNRNIIETIYYASLKASNDIAKELGSYETFKGSPFSEGLLQYHLWDEQPSLDKWDWTSLIEDIKKYGTRNSLLTSLMPTASTSQILGNNECFEPFTSNLYTRKTLAGEFIMINKHLVKDLIKLDLWSEEMKDKIVYYNGSVQNIDNIPDDIKELYKTVWEIPQKALLEQAKTRGPFIDQSQSMNIFMATPDSNRLTSSHFYAWKAGLKTGIYYLRSKPAANAIKFTIDTNVLKKMDSKKKKTLYVPGSQDCESCGS